MSAKEDQLFKELVIDKIQCDEYGKAKISLQTIRDYHAAVGLSDDVVCTLKYWLSNSENDVRNFMPDVEADEDVEFDLLDISFYDKESDEFLPMPNNLLDDNMMMCGALYPGMISGVMMFDYDGRLYLSAMVEENIWVNFVVDLRGNSGVHLVLDDLLDEVHVSLEDDVVCIEPTAVPYSGKLQS